jgi:hypothetical protein
MPDNCLITAHRQSADGSVPGTGIAGMNSAHSWHTMLVREHHFGPNWECALLLPKARFQPSEGSRMKLLFLSQGALFNRDRAIRQVDPFNAIVFQIEKGGEI